MQKFHTPLRLQSEGKALVSVQYDHGTELIQRCDDGPRLNPLKYTLDRYEGNGTHALVDQ